MKRFLSIRKKLALFLAVLLISGKLLPVFFQLPWKAEAAQPGDTMIAYGSGFHHYCIDGTGANRALIDGDEYVYILPSETLTREEMAIVFWGMLTLQASFGNVPQINAVIQNINAGASAQGVPAISNLVTEADLKLLIHSPSVRGKYPWLKTVLEKEETYLQLAGLLGGTARSAGADPQAEKADLPAGLLPVQQESMQAEENAAEARNARASGGGVPSVLQGHTQAGNPLQLTPVQGAERSGEYVLALDPSGADAEFIRSVPLKFSSTGAEGSFTAQVPGGWVCQKTDTEIRLTNTGGGGALYLMFDVRGTRYASGGGTFSSPEEVYEQCLQIWRCSRCSGTHRQMYNGSAPLSAHQRLAFVEVNVPQLCYYAGTGGAVSGGTGQGGGMAFEVYRHEEDWTSTYNVRLRKYDHETGKPLENAVFSLYERFDDKEEIHTDRDGAAYIYAGGAPYKSFHKDSPVLWDDFRFVSAMMTDAAGESAKTVEHGYHYDKTFCDGHPAPVFVSVPEEEENEETGEIENQEEIDAAKEENRRLAALWQNTYQSCEAWSEGDFSGVHFHWLMPEVDMGEIGNIASSGGEEGETPSAGATTSAGGSRSFSDSGCEDDTRETYERFISLKYSYAIAEDTAREGYTLHGNHSDDLPIEVIITDASEHGANADFAGIYSNEIRVSDHAAPEPAKTLQKLRQQAEEGRMVAEMEAPLIRKEQKPFWQKLFSIFIPVWIDEVQLIDDRKAEEKQGESLIAEATGSNAKATVSDAEATVEAKTPAAEQETLMQDTKIRMPAAKMYTAVQKATASDVENTENTKDTENTEDADRVSQQWILKLQFPGDQTETPGAAAVTEAAETATAVAATALTGFSKSGRRAAFAGGADCFVEAYNRGLNAASSGSETDTGSSDQYSHCNNADHEEDWWRIYDHRTEGELHINKRDMDLKSGESRDYDSYGDSQGDAVLEGAVYGLFAAENLVHPDGKTGIVYQKDDLVAVTTTDKNGDASFLAFTEAPGQFYQYESGQITNRPGGWNQSAPSNLYDRSQTLDDYTADGQYLRTYPDYQAANGNCWIGRPLLMGEYYVKELSRSEGYELSVGNRKHPFTNAGQDLNAAVSAAADDGYATVTKGLYAQQQVQAGASGAYGDPTFQELFFEVSSEKSGGFDLAFSGIPAGSRLYRLDKTVKTEPAQVGTGRFTEKIETDAWGNPVYVTAEEKGQYPKYRADGTMLTRERPVNRTVTGAECAEEKKLDTSRCEELMQRAETGMDEAAVQERLRKAFTQADTGFIKYKLELILRAHGKGTPKQTSDAGSRYTTLEQPVYDTGFASGSQVQYGAPVITLRIARQKENGEEASAGEILAALLDYYQENAYYSYGGVDRIEETEDTFLITLYAGRVGNPESFYVPERGDRSAAFYLRVPFVPQEHSGAPRYVYAVYTEAEEENSFGVYTDFAASGGDGAGTFGPLRVSALLVPDAAMDADGSLITRCVTENVYYEPGETPLDAAGNRIPKIQYIEETVPGETRKNYGNWTEITSKIQENVWHAESSYTDFYGAVHWDDTAQQYEFKLVLPGAEQVVLTQEDMAGLTGNWKPGDTMGAAAYYETVKRAFVRASLDYKTGIEGEENSFVKRAELVYPEQDAVWQDGAGRPGSGTFAAPVPVEERSIRQQIRISKTIEKTSYNNTDSYADVHEDWWTKTYDKAEAMENFRFKVYLKSNLQKLYRAEDGTVIWQDRKGNERNFAGQKQANTAFPELVNQIDTKVLHRTDPLYKNSDDAAVYNEALYAYQDGKIRKEPSSGYTALLETTEALVEDGNWTRTVKRPNYEKFFDAIETANHDKWDDAAPTYTSWRPIGNAANHSEDTIWNTRVSDRVRQFAITWYLDAEIAKLVQPSESAAPESTMSETAASGKQQPEYTANQGSTGFSDEILDCGLREAIIKAQNYLKPFFAYDLDELYAIAWDAEAEGGPDRDVTTVSADTRNESADVQSKSTGAQSKSANAQSESADVQNKSADVRNESGGAESELEYYGISAMLPYGTYVVVEQQPKYADLEDFKNRHYEVDKPKEISLPAVYTDEAGARTSPGRLDPFYQYKASYTAAELEKRYHIRFLEESHVIQAHSNRGDYEIYKYGMEIDRIQNGVPVSLAVGDYFALTQSEYRPFKNYYNVQDDRASGAVPYYLSEGQAGRNLVSAVYRYSSVSEQSQIVDDVWYPGGTVTEDNVPGIYYRDQVAAMLGSQTAYDGRYASALVPYSVLGADTLKNTIQTADSEATVPLDNTADLEKAAPLDNTADFGKAAPLDNAADLEKAADLSGTADSICLGYGNVRFRNRLYTARIRLEKLDSETHENILHDGAIFRIYAAKRDDAKDGEGKVLFYEEDTQIDGTKEFLTAMGAADIRPVLRGRSLGDLYTGVVPAGTPVCDESEQILLGDRFGLETGVMKAFVTVRDGLVPAPDGKNQAMKTKKISAGEQIAGNIEAVRNSKTAQELEYQLQTVGYLNTPQPLSAGTYVLCETKPPAGYVRSRPVALELYSDQVAYYQNGKRDKRVLSAIYEDPAEEQTTWKTKPQDQIHTARVYLENEPIRLQVEKRADCAENEAPGYAVGAKMTLFDAISLTPSGDSQDFTYEGLVIERNDAGHIERMYVKEGYGGEKTEFLPERDEEGHRYTVTWPAGTDRYGEIIQVEGNSWNSLTVMRPDTDILYYDLSDLTITITPETDGRDGRYQAFAWKGASKFLEFAGGDLTKISYDEKDKVLTLDEGTHVYHLGRDGARDALVDSYTGMAYVVKDFDGSNGSWDQIRGKDGTGAGKKQVLVWPVNLRKDAYGNIIARDKITTFRAALAGDGDHTYLTGSWKSEHGEESHRESTLHQNSWGQNRNEEILLDDNNGQFKKSMNPVYDRHGLVMYYPQSEETYDKAAEFYDRNGDFVRSQFSDNLEAYNHAAYGVQEHAQLFDENQTLLHRQGEAYVMENTWITSEKYPNDPFAADMTTGSADVLERVAAGCYIMEELQAPEGFVKALPVGIQVEEKSENQTVTMVDQPTKTEFSKNDGTETNSAFDCGYVEGAVLGLWKTGDAGSDTAENDNAKLAVAEGKSAPVTVWTTTSQPHSVTQLPTGRYFWKELEVPSGFVSHDPIAVTVAERPELQKYEMKEDHTRVEVEKYYLENGKDHAEGEQFLGGAGFTLYPACLDAAGNICYKDGAPEYDPSSVIAHWVTDDGTTYRDFPDAFETMYLEHGAKPGSSVMWDAGEHLYRAEYEAGYKKELLKPTDPEQTVYVYRMKNGAKIRIGVTREQDLFADHPFRFEYQFDWQKLSDVNTHACTYLTVENRQRFDYLPAGGSYVLVETKVPPGFARAGEVLITVNDTGDVQLYRVENEEGTLLISKVYEDGDKELAGARLALYRANEEGGLTKSNSYLFDSWISGSDGRYTELDAINRRIPQGYAEGDLKPHRIRRLPDGIYWLTEQKSPDYYTTFLPVEIVYEWQPEIRVVRVNDRLVTGTLKLEKTDSAGRMLEGAVFELAAYRETERQKLVQKLGLKKTEYREMNGQETADTQLQQPVFRLRLTAPAEQKSLPVGETGADGAIHPFWYELREVIQPPGYALNPEVIRWQFEPDLGVASYPWGGSAQKQITVTDHKTRIVIAKLDADAMSAPDGTRNAGAGIKTDAGAISGANTMTDETSRQYEISGRYEISGLEIPDVEEIPSEWFLVGARLAVYEITEKKEDGTPVYNPDAPLISWITQKKTPWHAVEGLTAGKEYLLIEEKSPEGYECFEPVCFQISEDGSRIVRAEQAKIWNGTGLIVVDRKIPKEDIPETPEPDKPKPEEEKTPGGGSSEYENPKIQPVLRIGKILAWYQPLSPDGAGWLYLGPDGRWKIRLPRLGDERKTCFFGALFLLSAASLYAVNRKNKDRKHVQKQKNQNGQEK